MTEPITLRLKSKTGNVNEIQVAEILEIDGKPYQPQGDYEQILQLLNHLSGKVATHEAMLAGMIGGTDGE